MSEAVQGELIAGLEQAIADSQAKQDALAPEIDAHDTRLRALSEEEFTLQARLEEIRSEAATLGAPHQARMQQFAELEEAIGHLHAAKHLLTR